MSAGLTNKGILLIRGPGMPIFALSIFVWILFRLANRGNAIIRKLLLDYLLSFSIRLLDHLCMRAESPPNTWKKPESIFLPGLLGNLTASFGTLSL